MQTSISKLHSVFPDVNHDGRRLTERIGGQDFSTRIHFLHFYTENTVLYKNSANILVRTD
jgi:hypothetical protein